MREKKAKWIGIVIIGIFALIHSYFFVLAYSDRSNFPNISSHLYLIDILIPLALLFSFVFGKKIGEMILIHTSDVDIYMDIVKEVLREVVLPITIIYFFIFSNSTFAEIFNFTFLIAIVINYFLVELTAHVAVSLLIVIKKIFF